MARLTGFTWLRLSSRNPSPHARGFASCPVIVWNAHLDDPKCKLSAVTAIPLIPVESIGSATVGRVRHLDEAVPVMPGLVRYVDGRTGDVGAISVAQRLKLVQYPALKLWKCPEQGQRFSLNQCRRCGRGRFKLTQCDKQLWTEAIGYRRRGQRIIHPAARYGFCQQIRFRHRLPRRPDPNPLTVTQGATGGVCAS